MSFHDQKKESRLVEHAAKYIAREAGRSTLITPTRAIVGNDKKTVTIYVSVFPTEEKDHALAFLARHRDPFRDYLKKEGRFSILPFIKFAFDEGEQNRQHLDDLMGHV